MMILTRKRVPFSQYLTPLFKRRLLGETSVLRAFMSRVPIGLVLSPGGLVLGLVFIPHILTQTQAAFDQFGSAVYNNI